MSPSLELGRPKGALRFGAKNSRVLARQQRRFTPEEYLIIEENSKDSKSEYYEGVIYAMTGGSINHARIVRNLLNGIDAQLRGKNCEVFGSDVRVFVEKHTLFTYPDLLVVCGELPYFPGRTDTLTDAKLIVEVLSPGTAHYDKGEKFQFYLGLPSLECYVTVAQDEILIQNHTRSQNGWQMVELSGPDATLQLTTLDLSLPCVDIYRDVELPV